MYGSILGNIFLTFLTITGVLALICISALFIKALLEIATEIKDDMFNFFDR